MCRYSPYLCLTSFCFVVVVSSVVGEASTGGILSSILFSILSTILWGKLCLPKSSTKFTSWSTMF